MGTCSLSGLAVCCPHTWCGPATPPPHQATIHTPGRLTSAWLLVSPPSPQIERQLFEETVKTLNSFYAEAEKIGGSSYLEGCLACATAYFIFLCMETHYEKVLPPSRPCVPFPRPPGCTLILSWLLSWQVLKKISRYIQEQNEKIFAPRGLLLTDPVERGMRVVSFLSVLCAGWGGAQGCQPVGSAVGLPGSGTALGPLLRVSWDSARVCLPALLPDRTLSVLCEFQGLLLFVELHVFPA